MHHEPAQLRLLTLAELVCADRDALECACRAFARPVYLGDSLALCMVLGRYKFYVDTRDMGFAPHVLLDGYWESWLTVFMARRIKPGMAVVDIGANHGYYTLLFADLAGPDGKVAAVEPNSKLCGLLRRSLALNGLAPRVRVLEQAAMDREGPVTMLIHDEESKNGRVYSPRQTFFDGAVTVRGAALAEDLADWDRVDFIKIDAEGSEERAVAGLWPILERDRPDVLLEFNISRCADASGFLGRLSELYGALRVVGIDGEPHTVDMTALLATDRHDDWIIYLSAAKDPS
jgi:FkbM family methyltransferase